MTSAVSASSVVNQNSPGKRNNICEYMHLGSKFIMKFYLGLVVPIVNRTIFRSQAQTDAPGPRLNPEPVPIMLEKTAGLKNYESSVLIVMNLTARTAELIP